MSDCTSKLFRFIPCCAPSNCFISAGLSQLVRFLIVKLIYLDLTWVLYLWLIILSVTGDVLIDNETLLVTNFVNFKIKPVQSFGCAHRNSVHTCIHRGECLYLYDYLRLYCFLEKKCFVPSAGFVQSQWKKAMKKSLSRALRNEVDRDDSGLKTSQSMSTDKGA
jgi:hypothetical protein